MEVITGSQVINKTIEDFPEFKESIEKGIEVLMIIASKICKKSFELKTRKSQLIIFIYSDIVETIQAAYKLCLQILHFL